MWRMSNAQALIFVAAVAIARSRCCCVIGPGDGLAEPPPVAADLPPKPLLLLA